MTKKRTDECGATAVPAATPAINPQTHRALESAARLRAALTRAGFTPEVDFPNLFGDTNIYREPIVSLGRFSCETADRLTALLDRIA
jgi:hypothetical protein